MVSGDITRYALSMQKFTALVVPDGSVMAWNTGVLIAKSINNAFQTMLDNPALQWAWIMGDDHTYDPDVVLRLLDREVDVVAPLCLNRLPPMDPTVVDHDKRRMKYLEDMPTSGLYQLAQNETCGDAGLLVRRSVLEAMPSPWYNNRISGAINAEDQAFVQRIKDGGTQVHIDLDVHLGHIGHVNFLPVVKDGKWEIRLMGGGARHICDLGPFPRADDAFVIK